MRPERSDFGVVFPLWERMLEWHLSNLPADAEEANRAASSFREMEDELLLSHGWTYMEFALACQRRHR